MCGCHDELFNAIKQDDLVKKRTNCLSNIEEMRKYLKFNSLKNLKIIFREIQLNQPTTHYPQKNLVQPLP